MRILPAFSLAEVVAALAIGTMVLVAVLNIYGGLEKTAASTVARIDRDRLAGEILQRIAEDLDSIVAAGTDVRLTIDNKYDNFYQTAMMEIVKNIYDSNSDKQVFEKITWQGRYDYEGGMQRLVLYRSHSGLTPEDKLLEEAKEKEQRELFVPVCEGLSYFKIQAAKGELPQDSWTAETLPNGIVVTISFAEPFKTTEKNFDVLANQKITRTVAIDRTRKIQFIFVKKEYGADHGQQNK